MKTLKQNGPDCLITATAMILDEEVETLKKEIAYDSLTKWWDLPNHTLSLRGYHIQEMLDCCMRRGYGLCVVDVFPRMAPVGHEDLWKLMDEKEVLLRRFFETILNQRGLLMGETASGLPHTVAWDGKKIHDPADGRIKDIKEFKLRECWMLVKLLESNHATDSKK